MKSSRTLARVFLILLALGAAVAPSPGCAGTGGTSPERATAPARERLAALAERQRARPDRPAQQLPAPQGVDAAAVAPLAPADLAPGSPAVLSLDEAVNALLPPAGEAVPADAGAGPTPESQKIYARGRAKLLDGRALDAARDLEAAVKIDPGSAQGWRELARAQRALGRRASSVASLKQAAALGIGDPEVYALLAREAMSINHAQDAAGLYAQAARAMSGRNDASLGAVIDAGLGESLEAVGYLAASAEARERALRVEPQRLVASRTPEDAAELFRRRGELWGKAGDTWCRVGRFDRAAAAYEQARQVPSLDPGAITPRLIHAHLRLGHSARAAMAILDEVEQASGVIEDRRHMLVSTIAHQTQVGDLMGDALGELAASVPDATPSVRARLARARAAALSTQPARAFLIEFLVANPQDADTAAMLLAGFEPAEWAARADAAARLADSSPAHAATYADILLSCGSGMDDTLSRLARPPATPGRRLLEARLLQRLGRHEVAIERLRSVDWSRVTDPGAFGVRAEVAATCADWDASRDSLARLEGFEGPFAARARAAALRSLQRFDDAYAALAPTLKSGATVDDDLRGAELAIRIARPGDARDLLHRAIAADRFDERPYHTLIELHAKSGPLPSDDEAIAAARSLRQAMESSRVIRGLSAQEMLSRSLWTQAEPVLLSMLDSAVETPAVLQLLVLLWEHSIGTNPELAERGESLLRERLERRPEAPDLIGALARVVSARGRPAEADEILRQALARHPVPELARLREHVVGVGLGKPDEARRLALERLERSPRTPDHAVEYVQVSGAGSDFEAAARVLDDWLPAGITLTPEQAGRLLGTLAGLTPETVAVAPEKTAADALRVFELIASRGVRMPAQMHVVRMTLLARIEPEATDRLVDAFRATVREYPDLERAAVARIAQTLSAREDPGPLLRFLGAVALDAAPANESLLFEWFRLTALRGSLADCRRLLESIEDGEALGALIVRVGDDDPLPAGVSERRAQLGYLLGNVLSAVDRDDLALDVYRYVLSLKPDHAWAANNLGYTLLERGGDLDEVQRLLDIAIAGLPDDGNVIDSIGWLRYKQGRLEDSLGPDGSVQAEGAVSLLSRAARTVKGQENSSVHDHLGDALWRSGRKAEARESWQTASRLAMSEYQRLPRPAPQQGEDPQADRRRRLQSEIQRLNLKARSPDDATPSIAPLASGT